MVYWPLETHRPFDFAQKYTPHLKCVIDIPLLFECVQSALYQTHCPNTANADNVRFVVVQPDYARILLVSRQGKSENYIRIKWSFSEENCAGLIVAEDWMVWAYRCCENKIFGRLVCFDDDDVENEGALTFPVLMLSSKSG